MAAFDPEITKENCVKITDYILPAILERNSQGSNEYCTSITNCNPLQFFHDAGSLAPAGKDCMM